VNLSPINSLQHCFYTPCPLSVTNLVVYLSVPCFRFRGKTYKLQVQPGPEGLASFKKQVQNLLGFDLTSDFEVTFECRVNGQKTKLSGLHSYHAATHCAAISAAQREARKPHWRRSQRTLGANNLDCISYQSATAPLQESAGFEASSSQHVSSVNSKWSPLAFFQHAYAGLGSAFKSGLGSLSRHR
jgi:hypothetical protein